MSIKDLRIKNGWSQEYLAQLTNLSSRTIQRIEKDNKASLESVNALAKAFQLEVSELKELIEKNKNQEELNSISTNNFINFLKHDKGLVIFLFVNTFLIIINLITNPEVLWFIYPLLGWGIPLFYKRYKKYYI
ncbi:helix-turn-helix domain-containing protein [Arcobacter roscoffensis]|uniref:Helix-turn-helix domain-containing protein n=1 Tax=Arcobacter roscoffensis TaxID=2961520 RepID=A0ABY5DZP6_9BACT|nr:helix-turn-helix domain-containing protein [Arcobacter roscoffensis]UTJ05432.1 helix-turn-helix domain-containing protein [Arcobacter roscoffensis]